MNAVTQRRNPLLAALVPEPSSAEEISALWALNAGERVDAMWRGELSLAQLCAWSSRRPHEVPLLDGEFAWIVMRTPGWAEVDDSPGHNLNILPEGSTRDPS